MIMIKETKDRCLIHSIVTHPSLFELSGYTVLPEHFHPNLNYLWLQILYKNLTLGIIELRPYTDTTLEGHIYILPEFQGGHFSLLAAEKAKEYLAKYSIYKNVLIIVPDEANHVHRFMKRLKASECGCIKDGIKHRNKIQDLHLYQIKIQ